MQIVHECGHALVAWLSGGHVQRLVLEFASFSRTDINPNPHPLAVSWAGPLIGAVTPSLIWRVMHSTRVPGARVLGFFAGFCLVANGAYIGLGAFEGIGDAGDVLAHGSPRWALWLFGLVCVPSGLYVWHTLGRHPASPPGADNRRRPWTFVTGFLALALVVIALV